ncbi:MULTISPECIES: hypothetical protein [Delftia]|jgi:hypothetical protein|uniref:hypothetical protein n=1 Tax=Delftia TaxID=80865 RepID=UPI00034E4F8A|nr:MULTISPECIES: hypothetical protein [Delftia]EPD41104.1 hypothetical protein HMPREF9702_03205 [Delftia acidovorans CCUG 15835]QFS65796.1 hypothetical protein GCS91_16430 [Delftia tsuruhatensis]WON87371.1 hypothetical protein OK021_21850 [Delftia sp. UGAL515B_04]
MKTSIYQLSHEKLVFRKNVDGTTSTIAITDTPEFPNRNPDYLAYLAWCADGNVPSPADPLPVPVPSTITRAQGKAALIQAGLWPQVLAFMAGIEDPNDKLLAEVALNDTVNWERSSPFLARVAAELGLSQQQLDELFIAAAAIVL